MKQAKPFIPPESPITSKVNYPLKKQFIEIQHFEIYESQANYLELTDIDISLFRDRKSEDELLERTTKQFVAAIKEELKYHGFTIEELAKATYITFERMKTLLKGKTYFRKQEILDIKKKLHID